MTRRIEREPDQKGRSIFLDWFQTLLLVVVKVKGRCEGEGKNQDNENDEDDDDEDRDGYYDNQVGTVIGMGTGTQTGT